MRGETAGTPAPDPTLKSLAVTDKVLSPALDPGVQLYSAKVDNGTGDITLTAATNDDDAQVVFGPWEDADPEQSGHQVVLPYGETLVTALVTASNGETERLYRIVVERPSVAVSFESASYTAIEGGDAVSVVVRLSADPGWDVTIPLTARPNGGAAANDYTVPAIVTFTSGGGLSQTVEVAAVADEDS